VRLAILISFAAFGLSFFVARADEPLIKVTLDAGPAYIVTESYATAHKSELVATIPGPVKIDGFWTPTEVDVIVAERVFRELIHSAVKDPTLLFPDLAPSTDPAVPADLAVAAQLENERYELTLVSSNYDRYSRQYVGIIIDGQQLVFCNYADVPKVDPSTGYIFIDQVFVADGSVHFLQCRFDPMEKTCSNVSMIGSWQRSAK
jgi:hypothetical protein